MTCEDSTSARLVRGVSLPVTLTVADRTTALVIRVDGASTYCILERPWAAYCGLTWESGDPVAIGTAVGGLQASLHVVEMHMDRCTWETPVAIAACESPRGAVPRQVLGFGGFFDRCRVTIDDQDERITIAPHW